MNRIELLPKTVGSDPSIRTYRIAAGETVAFAFEPVQQGHIPVQRGQITYAGMARVLATSGRPEICSEITEDSNAIPNGNSDQVTQDIWSTGAAFGTTQKLDAYKQYYLCVRNCSHTQDYIVDVTTY